MNGYIHELGPLFEAVQLQAVFADGKTFPDCLPKAELSTIGLQYEMEKDGPGFDLKTFVQAHFDLPKAFENDYASDASRSAEQHVEALWDVLTRQPDEAAGSLLALPHPYVAPGGRFREIYYWDSYFTLLGLRASGRLELVTHMLDNFAYLIDTFGYIPNGNRAYYLGRSQPPFFSLMVQLVAAEKGTAVWTKYRPQLEAEYRFWMDGAAALNASSPEHRRVVRLPDGALLNRYWDDHATPRPESYKEDVELAHAAGGNPAELYRHLRAAAESGWDFSSRWFRHGHDFTSIHTTDILPVDLNCLLWNLENTLAEAGEQSGDSAAAAHYHAAAERRAAAIQRYFWDESAGFYLDFDFPLGKNTSHRSLAAVFPLFFGLAETPAAAAVAQLLQERFLQSGGLVTTLEKTGQQWDSPNGWAPLQWMAYQGLLRYGHVELAQRLSDNWLNTCRRVYRETGKMMEKYDVFGAGGPGGGGEYPNQDGFGWTNGVFLALSRPRYADGPSA